MIPLLIPNWPVAERIKSCSTTRNGGVSPAPYSSLNLGDHVNDLAQNVRKNRALLVEQARLPSKPVWLEQVHGTEVLTLDGSQPLNLQADAVYSRTVGQVCAIMTADCLPVLFCSKAGNEVAAAHAGWRSLCYGVLENTVNCFQAVPQEIIAWLGPAIGPQKFEVGGDVRDAFIDAKPQAIMAFKTQGDKYLADIYLLARQRLESLGITAIYGGDYCTVSDKSRFFSYRRDRQTGRMASLIWLEPNKIHQ